MLVRQSDDTFYQHTSKIAEYVTLEWRGERALAAACLAGERWDGRLNEWLEAVVIYDASAKSEPYIVSRPDPFGYSGE
jgi:hypothetical protein